MTIPGQVQGHEGSDARNAGVIPKIASLMMTPEDSTTRHGSNSKIAAGNARI